MRKSYCPRVLVLIGSHVIAAVTLALVLPAPGEAFGQTRDTDAAPPAAPPATGGAAAITREATDRPTLRAYRVAGGIDVDGRLEERFYAETPPAEKLVQAVPIEGGVPSELTEIWIAFDNANVYIAARVWDSEGM